VAAARPESLNPERRGVYNSKTTLLDAVLRKGGRTHLTRLAFALERVGGDGERQDEGETRIEQGENDPKALLFQSYSRATGKLTGNPLPQANAYAMIQRRAKAADITTKIGNHTFRATGASNASAVELRLRSARVKSRGLLRSPGGEATETTWDGRFEVGEAEAKIRLRASRGRYASRKPKP
jgi:hypothetical protein